MKIQKKSYKKRIEGKIPYIILIALANVVTTKGSESQNHGLKFGIISMIVITIAEIKKYNHHLPDPSVVFILLICANIIAMHFFIKINPNYK